MNYKRCALRNEIKKRAILTLAKGIDIGAISHLLDDTTNQFLDKLADTIEKIIKDETSLKCDQASMDEIMTATNKTVTEEVLKTTLGLNFMNAIRTSDGILDAGESMKWVGSRGGVEQAVQLFGLHSLTPKELNAATINAFILASIEETDTKIAVRKSMTALCKSKGMTADNYRDWLEEED